MSDGQTPPDPGPPNRPPWPDPPRHEPGRPLRPGDATPRPPSDRLPPPRTGTPENSRKYLTIVAVLAVVILLKWWWDRPRWPEDVAVPELPEQSSVPSGVRRIDGEGWSIEPLARYRIRALVLGTERYRVGTDARFSPVDFALGWGPMSSGRVLEHLQIRQAGRFYHYRWRDDPPMAPHVLSEHSANVHIVPADDDVRDEVLRVKPGDIIVAEGWLVRISDTTGWRWESSLSRTDTGNGACEVFRVERIVRE